MARRSLQEEILEAFLIALDEKLDKRNTYTKKDIEVEEEEFERAGIDSRKVARGRGVTLPNLRGVGNTDAEDMMEPKTRFGRMRKWARTMQSNKKGIEEDPKGKIQRRAVFNQVQSDTDRPSVISSTGRGGRKLQGGNTRASLRRILGKPIKAHIFKKR
jgi:hypothetical protein